MFQFLSRNSHLSVVCLRIAVAMVFVYHGYVNLFVAPVSAAQQYGAMGIPFAPLFAKVAGGIQFAGGLMVGLGLLTRQASLLLFVLMLVVVAFAYRHGYGAIERDAQLMVLCLATMFGGSGRWSLESMVRKHGD